MNDVSLKIGALELSKLSTQEAKWLERDLNLEEFEFVLNHMPAEKAPGPDGFNVSCLKIIRDSIKVNTMECFMDFTATGALPLGVNSSFIALIPN